jgi:hypothetical protein
MPEWNTAGQWHNSITGLQRPFLLPAVAAGCSHPKQKLSSNQGNKGMCESCTASSRITAGIAATCPSTTAADRLSSRAPLLLPVLALLLIC